MIPLRLLVVLPLTLAPAIAPAAQLGVRPMHLIDDDDEPIEVDLIELTLIDWRPKGVPRDQARRETHPHRGDGVGTVEGVDTFNLVTSGCSCGTTKLQHFVKVTLADDVTQFTPDEITLTGTFSVGEVEEDGFVTSLYRLKDAAIE
jgi:hypothetical protein